MKKSKHILTTEQIRRVYEGDEPSTALARSLGVPRHIICNIRSGMTSARLTGSMTAGPHVTRRLQERVVQVGRSDPQTEIGKRIAALFDGVC